MQKAETTREGGLFVSDDLSEIEFSDLVSFFKLLALIEEIKTQNTIGDSKQNQEIDLVVQPESKC